MKVKISKKKLYKLYWKKEYSLNEIGEILNCARQTIRNNLQKFGIKIRSRKEIVNTKRFKKLHSTWNVRENNPSWKGGIIQDGYGYIYILKPKHPRANNSGYVKRSYLVAEEMLGRYLYSNEITHHKNGIRNDDNPENIKVTTRKKHADFHRGKYGRLEAIK